MIKIFCITSLTQTPNLSPWKCKSLGRYSVGFTCLKPLSAPPFSSLKIGAIKTFQLRVTHKSFTFLEG